MVKEYMIYINMHHILIMIKLSLSNAMDIEGITNINFNDVENVNLVFQRIRKY